MALIKSSITSGLAREAIVLDLGDLRRQGEVIIEHAKREAERILATAREERARLISTAAQEGRAEGLADGLAQGHREGMEQGRQAALAERREALAQVQQAWMLTLQSFVERREAMYDDARRDLLALACLIARRVTHRVVELDPTVVKDQVAGVMAMVMRPSRLTLRIHPVDREVVSAALGDLMRTYAAATHVEVVDDAGVSRGSCIARLSEDVGAGQGAAAGRIDASIQTQIERIVEAILPGASVIKQV